MCHILPLNWVQKITYFFKHSEWFFWLCQVWIIINLINTRYFFNGAIGFMNWLIHIHDFKGSMISTEKAFERFRRDFWVLLILNFVIIGLIHLL